MDRLNLFINICVALSLISVPVCVARSSFILSPSRSVGVASLLSSAPFLPAKKSSVTPSALRSAHANDIRSFSSSPLSGSAALSLDPVDFGGDPSGHVDSTAAVESCIAACAVRALESPNGYFPGWRSFGNGHAIGDAGGCFINLNGGEYLISKPLNIPEYLGNLVLGYGSLVAAQNFTPADGFILSVGAKGDGCNVPQASCNVDISFPFIFIDGRHVANAVQFNHLMGGVVGPGAYILNFTHYGIQINGGHEVEITHTWLGETNWDFDHLAEDVQPNATAIEINGNDHLVHFTVIFSARVGLAVHGAANLVQGVHVWFPWNNALAFASTGTMAFWVTSPQNRFTGCYIDGGRAVLQDEGASQTVWDDGFECCASETYAKVPHGIILASGSIGPGLVITHNIFEGGAIYQESTSNMPSLTNSIISDNFFNGVSGPGTRASMSLFQANATKWLFDFTSKLIIPTIATIRADVVATDGFPKWIIRPAVGAVVVVEMEEPVSAQVSVEVDSSSY